MLIIPLDRPIDWRRPPLVILFLLLANVGIHFGLQLGDRQAEAEAAAWYQDSGLAEIELPRYRDWLLVHGDRGEQAFAREHDDPLSDSSRIWFVRMLGDGDFQHALAAGDVVAPDEDVHSRWQSLRSGFERRLAASTSMTWGLRPSQPEPLTWLTHMFLHADVIHLVGNMIFLVAVGFLVEMALGSLILLGLYTLAGVGAAALFVLVNPGQALPLVGASGAIAGLMGMLAVVWGMQKIRFFYFIGVYFDYVKAPALVLLPLWLGYEVYQYLSAAELDPVAYSAHVGGLLTGAVAAGGMRWGTAWIDHDVIAQPDREAYLQQELDTIAGAVRDLRPEVAQPVVRRLQVEFPGDPRVLHAAWEAARLEPAGPRIHEAAHAIFLVAGDDRDTRDWIVATWRDYRERARPRPRLTVAVIEHLVAALLAVGDSSEADRLLRPMHKYPQRFAAQADLACRLAAALAKQGRVRESRHWYALIADTWPESSAGRLAARALGR